MTTQQAIEKISEASTMPELDALRMDVADAMMSGGGADFQRIQSAFITAKNRLLRVPLRDRKW